MPATQKSRSPKGRWGVHQTPWQCTLSHACHAKDAEPEGTPGRTSDPLAVHIVPRLPRKRRGARRDARAYIRPLGSAHCPTPATQKRRSPKGRQGVHPTPWQCRLSHACHAKEAEPQGTPGRTSNPLAVQIVPRLPRKSGGAPRDARAYIQTPWQCTLSHACPHKRGGAPRDARAYIRPLGSTHCPTPAMQKRRSPKGRQGVHPDPLAVQIVPRLPRKRGGAPRDARAYIQTPWQCRLSHACHAKAAEPQGTPGRTSNPLAVQIVAAPATQKTRSPKGRQGVHPDPLAVHIVPRLPRKSGGAPRDARAYIQTPWQCTLSHACHTKEAEPQGTPGRTSDPLAVHIVPRLPRKRGGAPRDARAYIPTPWQYTLSHACHAKEAEPQGTPGRTSDPLALHIVARLPRKRGGAPRDARAYIRPLGTAHCPTPATQKRRSPKGRQGVQKRRSPKGRQGVHPTPWQCRLSHACHAKAAEPQGTPGRTSDPLAVHIVPRLPRKSGGAPRDARAYIQPLGSADCPTPATQKRRSPKGRQGVHQTPWQCTLSHACHAKEAEPQGTPGCTSDPLAVHIVPRLPGKSGGAPRDARAYIQPLGSAHCPTPATQKCV